MSSLSSRATHHGPHSGEGDRARRGQVHRRQGRASRRQQMMSSSNKNEQTAGAVLGLAGAVFEVANAVAEEADKRSWIHAPCRGGHRDGMGASRSDGGRGDLSSARAAPRWARRSCRSR